MSVLDNAADATGYPWWYFIEEDTEIDCVDCGSTDCEPIYWSPSRRARCLCNECGLTWQE